MHFTNEMDLKNFTKDSTNKILQNDIQLDNTVTRIVYLKCIAL